MMRGNQNINTKTNASPITKKNKLYGPFLWMEFDCLRATELLLGDSLLFTIQFPGVPGTQLINLGRM